MVSQIAKLDIKDCVTIGATEKGVQDIMDEKTYISDLPHLEKFVWGKSALSGKLNQF